MDYSKLRKNKQHKHQRTKSSGEIGGDTVKLIVVSAFVLIVFISGVLVGVKFFNTHEAGLFTQHSSSSFVPSKPKTRGLREFIAEHRISSHQKLPPGLRVIEKHQEEEDPYKPLLKEDHPDIATIQKRADAIPGLDNHEIRHDEPEIRHESLRANHDIIAAAEERIVKEPKATEEKSLCCNEKGNVLCLACKASTSKRLYCLQHPNEALSGCDTDVFPMKALALGGGHLETKMPVDMERLTFSAWIYMDSKDRSAKMKTIVANRFAGCDPSIQRNGYALYVNEWDTADRSLILMTGNQANACIKIKSSPGLIQYSEWTHVGFIIDNNEISLFCNGAKVASATVSPRPVQNTAKTFIGKHADGEAPFNGKVARITFFQGAFQSALLWPDEKTPGPLDVPSSLTSSLLLSYSFAVPSLGGIPVRSKVTIKDESSKHNDCDFYPRGMEADNTVVVEPLDDSDFLVKVPLEQMVEGTFPDVTDAATLQKSDERGRKNRELVRNAMKHAYGSYEKHAFGFDELKPQSGRGHNPWGGFGVTMVDSLDTLWLMDMKDEFYRARDWCESNLSFNSKKTVSVFETTIRDLGGLLSAYDLSGEKIFLQKAQELGDRLMPAFNTPTGIPKGQVNLGAGSSSNPSWTGSSSVLAEIGTLQLEFRDLSYHTGDPKYAIAAEKVHTVLRANNKPMHGLYPIYINPKTGKFSNQQVTFGALGDSFYEYLLKIWVQGGMTEPLFKEDYDAAMDGVMEKLLQKSTPTGLSYLADWNGGRLNHKMDHLVCFVPGMLALGAYRNGKQHKNYERDMRVAKAVLYTCVQMYERQPTGIAPEYVEFKSGADLKVPPRTPFYILRPETVESLFILHHITKHPIYRDWGHRIMQNIEKYCKTKLAYGALPDVRSTTRKPDDRMESFFLAETLKYLFLLQDPEQPIDLTKYVFNTEAHPLRIFRDGWRSKLENGDAAPASV